MVAVESAIGDADDGGAGCWERHLLDGPHWLVTAHLKRFEKLRIDRYKAPWQLLVTGDW
jgi:hypothetical protein